MTRDEYLLSSDQRLLADCQVDRFRASGPGGQKRNKTDSAVRVRHDPTGLIAIATESRSQHENKARAVRRLRMVIALELRVPCDGSVPSVLGHFDGAGEYFGVNLKNPKYPLAVAGVLDVLDEAGGRVSHVASILGVTTARLIAFFKRDPKLWARVNKMRERAGVGPLR